MKRQNATFKDPLSRLCGVWESKDWFLLIKPSICMHFSVDLLLHFQRGVIKIKHKKANSWPSCNSWMVFENLNTHASLNLKHFIPICPFSASMLINRIMKSYRNNISTCTGRVKCEYCVRIKNKRTNYSHSPVLLFSRELRDCKHISGICVKLSLPS